MLISTAYAAAETVKETAVAVPTAGETFMTQMGLLCVVAVIFYFLMIRPQQARYREHAEMINALGKGTKVVTQGGLIGVITKEIDDNEVEMDIGGGTKVKVLRSAVSSKYEDAIAKKPSAPRDAKKEAPKDAKKEDKKK